MTALERAGHDRGPAPWTTVVADDFTEARLLLCDALSLAGSFSVVATAGDGIGALEAVGEHRPDLAVLDLAMPRAGGLDVIAEINALSPATRAVVVSGFSGQGLENMALAAGAAGYVSKRPAIREVVDEITVAASLLELAGEALATTQRFPDDISSPRQARRFLDGVLERWHCEPAIATVQTLLSELVTNAVVHARSKPEVSVLMLGDRIRVEVADASSDLPMPVPLGGLEPGGRGLAIVAAEASRWGVRSHPAGGKTVWFDVPVFTTP